MVAAVMAADNATVGEAFLARLRADADVMEKARSALRDLLGNVTVIEEEDGVFARVDLAKVCITDGAQERT